MTIRPIQGRRASAIGGVVVAAAIVATACGGGSPSSSGGGGKPVAGNTLTVAVPAPPNSLNPGKVDNAFADYTVLAYDPLIYQASDGSLQPDVASSWKYLGSGNTQFQLTIRPGVSFSDGGTVTAADVKASLMYAKTDAGDQSAMLAGVSSIDVTGPLTVVLHLSTPDPLLPETLTQNYGVGEVISPKGLANPGHLSVTYPSAGTGPYVFSPAQSVAGDHYTYLARSGYFDPSRQHYKKVVLRVIANPQAEVNALTTGQVDVVVAGDASTASQVKSAGMHIASVPFVFQGLDLIDRTGEISKPLGDVRVRQAINYAIDRQTLAKAVLGTYGVPTDETVLPGADGYSPAAASEYPYDPAKAKQLLTQAGYPNGFTLPVATISLAGIGTMAQAVAGQLAKVGIKLDITTVSDAASYLTDATSHKFPAIAVGYGAQPMYLEGQGLFLPSAAVFNGYKTPSPQLDGLFAQAAAASPARRAQLDEQMEKYLVDNAWLAPVAFSPVLYFSRPNVGGVTVSPNAPTATPLDWYQTAS